MKVETIHTQCQHGGYGQAQQHWLVEHDRQQSHSIHRAAPTHHGRDNQPVISARGPGDPEARAHPRAKDYKSDTKESNDACWGRPAACLRVDIVGLRPGMVCAVGGRE
jgi:hypothetical protein